MDKSNISLPYTFDGAANPSIICTPFGQIICVFSCYQKHSNSVAIALSQYADQKWQDPRVVFHFQGRLPSQLVTCYWNNQLYVFFGIKGNDLNENTTNYMLISYDNGHSFTDPLPIQLPKNISLVNSPIVTTDCLYLIAVQYTENHILLLKTKNGDTWNVAYKLHCNTRPKVQLLKFAETSWGILYKDSSPNKKTFMSLSEDSGKTWQSPQDTHIPDNLNWYCAMSYRNNIFIAASDSQAEQPCFVIADCSRYNLEHWELLQEMDEESSLVSEPHLITEGKCIWGVYLYGHEKSQSLRVSSYQFRNCCFRYPSIKSFKNCHKGKSVFILASGPSLASLDLSCLDSQIVIGLNRSFLKYPHSQYHCMTDQNLFSEYTDLQYHPSLITLKGRPWGTMIDYLGLDGFSLDLEEGIYTGHSIAYYALQIAVYMGFKQIFFLGLDLQVTRDLSHFFGRDYRATRLSETDFPLMKRDFERARHKLNLNHIRVFNCSPITSLETFPKITLEKALKLAASFK